MRSELTPERLLRITTDFAANSRRQALDFDAVTVSLSYVEPQRMLPSDVELYDIEATYKFDYYPLLHPQQTGIREFVRTYVSFLAEVENYNGSSEPEALKRQHLMVFLFIAGEMVQFNPDLENERMDSKAFRTAYRDTAIWLRDHEVDDRIKQLYTDVLTELDASWGVK